MELEDRGKKEAQTVRRVPQQGGPGENVGWSLSDQGSPAVGQGLLKGGRGDERVVSHSSSGGNERKAGTLREQALSCF